AEASGEGHGIGQEALREVQCD
ncbi:MAG: hypothetical protein RL345_2213, partial [Chloroflexota bacterium]